MKLAFEITDPRQEAGLNGALADFNARPGQSPGNVALDAGEFVLTQLGSMLNAWADHYDVATTSDKKLLEDAIIADPVAVKLAIEARRAKEAQAVADVAAEVKP